MAIPLLALIPLITSLAPLAGKLLGNAIDGKAGQKIGEDLGHQAQDIIGDVFGTTKPDEVEKLARTDPAKAAEFRAKIMELANAAQALSNALQIEEMRAELEDVMSARNTMVELVKANSGLGWAPAVMTVITTLGFIGVLMLMLMAEREWGERQATVINVAVGILGTAFVACVQFWVGSSAGSKRSGDAVRQQAQTAVTALATSVPATVAKAAQAAAQESREDATAARIAGGQLPPANGQATPTAANSRARQPMVDAPGAADALNDEAWRVAREQ